jgi:hypothetical protein
MIHKDYFIRQQSLSFQLVCSIDRTIAEQIGCLYKFRASSCSLRNLYLVSESAPIVRSFVSAFKLLPITQNQNLNYASICFSMYCCRRSQIETLMQTVEMLKFRDNCGVPIRQPYSAPIHLTSENTRGNFCRRKLSSEEITTTASSVRSDGSMSTKPSSNGGVPVKNSAAKPSLFVETVKGYARWLTEISSGSTIPPAPSGNNSFGRGLTTQPSQTASSYSPSSNKPSSATSLSPERQDGPSKDIIPIKTALNTRLPSGGFKQFLLEHHLTLNAIETPTESAKTQSWRSQVVSSASNNSGALTFDDGLMLQKHFPSNSATITKRDPFEVSPPLLTAHNQSLRRSSLAAPNISEDTILTTEPKDRSDSTAAQRSPCLVGSSFSSNTGSWRSARRSDSTSSTATLYNARSASDNLPSVGFHNHNERIANGLSNVTMGESHTVSLRPCTATHKDPYTPTLMLLDRTATRQGNEGPRAYAEGEKYLGDKNSSSYKEHRGDLPDLENCALYLSKIPLTMTETKIFDLIDCGAVYTLYLKEPDAKHSLKAADLVFMAPESAAIFYAKLTNGDILMDNQKVRVKYNKFGLTQKDRRQSRVIFIQGPEEIMTIEFWEKYMKNISVFVWERVIESAPVNSGKLMQFRYSRIVGQAQPCLQALLRDRNMMELGVIAGYMADPCGPACPVACLPRFS